MDKVSTTVESLRRDLGKASVGRGIKVLSMAGDAQVMGVEAHAQGRTPADAGDRAYRAARMTNGASEHDAERAAALAAGAAVVAQGGSVQDAAAAAHAAATRHITASPNSDPAVGEQHGAESAGFAAGAAVLARGGCKEEAARVAGETAKDYGAKPLAMGTAAGLAMEMGGGSHPEVGNAAYAAASSGGPKVAAMAAGKAAGAAVVAKIEGQQVRASGVRPTLPAAVGRAAALAALSGVQPATIDQAAEIAGEAAAAAVVRRGGGPDDAIKAAVDAARVTGGSEQAQSRAKALAEHVSGEVRGRGTYVGVLKEGQVDAAVLTAQLKDAGERLDTAKQDIAMKEEALPSHLKVSGALEDLRQAEVAHAGAVREVEELEGQMVDIQVTCVAVLWILDPCCLCIDMLVSTCSYYS